MMATCLVRPIDRDRVGEKCRSRLMSEDVNQGKMEDPGSKIYFLGETSITQILREIMEFPVGSHSLLQGIFPI